MQAFHYALKPGGHLFLGPSESATRDAARFKVIDRKHRILRRRDDGRPALPGVRSANTVGLSLRDVVRPTPGNDRIERNVRAVMGRHSPAFFVIDRQHDIVRFSGAESGRYLEPSAGAASLNLFALLRKSLRPLVRAAVQKALAEHQAVVEPDLVVGGNDVRRTVTLIVEPIEGGLVIVAFRETAAPEPAAEVGDGDQRAVERELRATKAQLRAALDEFETHMEGTGSATEEMQSVNEELQSTNEELETAKEEMQSINEELQTVNGEVQGKNEALGRLNDDLQNLLDSTRIATIFLDKELCIRSFTPAMTEIFRLREGDQSRLITEIVSRLDYDGIERDVESVQRTLAVVEQEVHLKGNREATFLMRIRPYRTLDDRLDGVVITFVDVTAMKRAEKAQRDLELSFQLAQEAAGIGAWRWDLRTNAMQCTPESMKLMGHEPADGPLCYERLRACIHPEDVEAFEGELHKCREGSGDWEREYRIVRRDGIRWLLGKGHLLRDDHGAPVQMIGINLDITERKAGEDHVRFLLSELRHRTNNVLAVAQALVGQTALHSRSVADFAKRYAARLEALARAQALLGTLDWQGASPASIVQTALAPFIGTDVGRLLLQGPDVVVRPNAVQTLSLALNELATNAAKYGALSVPCGKIEVHWRLKPDGAAPQRMQMSWRESGGPPVAPPARKGFGRSVIEDVAQYELAATVTLVFPAEGVCWTLDMPATHLASAGGGQVKPS
jgi:two-component system CheB/CheR fusion protein